MILSDSQILEAMENGEIRFQPEVSISRQLQPASVDLRLASHFRVFQPNRCSLINPRVPADLEEITTLVEVARGQAFIVHPGEFVLGSTLEYLWLCDRYVVALYPGMRVCQVSFLQTGLVIRPYVKGRPSKYQGQSEPTASRLSLDEEFLDKKEL
jgi:dCTP deaminase